MRGAAMGLGWSDGSSGVPECIDIRGPFVKRRHGFKSAEVCSSVMHHIRYSSFYLFHHLPI